MTTLAHREFREADQENFARLSGDRNPLHIDPLLSRRLLFGHSVVHGVHTLIWALDAYSTHIGQALHLTSLKVDFRSPIAPGQQCRVSVSNRKGRVVLEVHCDERRSMVAKLTIENDSPKAPTSSFTPLPGCPDVSSPVRLERTQLATASGGTPLQLDEALLGELFPGLKKWGRRDQLAILLASTRIVGMKCPGMDSLFTGLRLDFTRKEQGGEPIMQYSTRLFEPRFNLLEIDLQAPGLQGNATCHSRPQPFTQPGFQEVQSQLDRNCYADQVALVIGGSRGLGALTATMIAAGGGEVLISYSRGREDAESLAETILAAGGRATTVQLDVTDSRSIQALKIPGNLNHLYYFATPKIERNDGPFNNDLADTFRRVYLGGFEACVAGALERVDSLTVFYPSTVYVSQPERGFAEYTLVKQEGEDLCSLLQRKHPRLRIHAPQLPRLATDQTMGLLDEDLPEALPVLIQELRTLSS